MEEKDTKKFWRKLLGYKIGEEITVTYEVEVYAPNNKVFKGDILVSGKVSRFLENKVVIESWNGVCVNLEEDRIKDVREATMEDKKELKLTWGGHLGSILQARKGSN